MEHPQESWNWLRREDNSSVTLRNNEKNFLANVYTPFQIKVLSMWKVLQMSSK